MHTDTILQFSGGKDSLACLYLYKNSWHDLTVVFINTGAAYPEILSLMDEVKKVVPHFLEVKSDQPQQINDQGYPSDIVPLRYTRMGRLMGLKSNFLLQDYTNCCADNIWRPMLRAIRNIGAKTIIRGQRISESRTSPIHNGDTIDGIKYILPIEYWTDKEVLQYLKKMNVPIPSYYETEKTSRDCWSCTAYLDENKQRILNLPNDKKALVLSRLAQIKTAINDEMRNLDECLQ